MSEAFLPSLLKNLQESGLTKEQALDHIRNMSLEERVEAKNQQNSYFKEPEGTKLIPRLMKTEADFDPANPTLTEFNPDNYANTPGGLVFGPEGKIMERTGELVGGLAAASLLFGVVYTCSPTGALAQPLRSTNQQYVLNSHYNAKLLDWLLNQDLLGKTYVPTMKALLDVFDGSEEAMHNAEIRFDYNKLNDALNILVVPNKNNPNVGYALALWGEKNDGVLEQLQKGKLPIAKGPEEEVAKTETRPELTREIPKRTITPEQHLIWGYGEKADEEEGRGGAGAKVLFPPHATVWGEAGSGQDQTNYALAIKADLNLIQALIGLNGYDLKNSRDQSLWGGLSTGYLLMPHFSVFGKKQSTPTLEGVVGLDKGEDYCGRVGVILPRYAIMGQYDQSRRDGKIIREGTGGMLAVNFFPETVADYVALQDRSFKNKVLAEKYQDDIAFLLKVIASHTRPTDSSLESDAIDILFGLKGGWTTLEAFYSKIESHNAQEVRMPDGSTIPGSERYFSNTSLGLDFTQRLQLGGNNFYVFLGGKMNTVEVADSQERSYEGRAGVIIPIQIMGGVKK